MSKKVRPLGQIMHDLEDSILYLCYKKNYSWNEILFYCYETLKSKHANNQEEYVSGGNPVLKLNRNKKVIKKNKALDAILKEFSVDHDMQWYEALYLVYGYLQVHCIDKKDKNFKFYYGA